MMNILLSIFDNVFALYNTYQLPRDELDNFYFNTIPF